MGESSDGSALLVARLVSAVPPRSLFALSSVAVFLRVHSVRKGNLITQVMAVEEKCVGLFNSCVPRFCLPVLF